MNKHAPVLWFCLFLLLVFPPIPTVFAHANKPLIVDFGSIAPIESMSRSLPVTIPATVQAIRAEGSGLTAEKSGNRIPAERLTLTAVNRSGSSGNAVVFQLKIELLPSDPPGEYEGLFFAVPADKKGQKLLPILVKVQILPWIRIEPVSSNPLLSIAEAPFVAEDNLSTHAPVKLLLASNAPWRLLLRVGNRTPFNTPPFPLHIGIGKTIKTVDFKERILPGDDYRPVAFGAPTVVGEGSTPANYWTELYFTVALANWHQYATGDYDFNLLFTAETLVP